MRTTRSLRGGYALLGLLALGDLLLTAYLLLLRPGQFYESNPLARWALEHGGWAGLVGFKIFLVLVAASTVTALARWRPRTAARVLHACCCLTALVVVYSCGLVAAAQAETGVLSLRDDATIEAEARLLKDKVRQAREYTKILDRVSAELAAGHCTVAQAVRELAATEKGRDPVWLGQLRRLFRARTDREGLAASLLRYTYGPSVSPLDTELSAPGTEFGPRILIPGRPPVGSRLPGRAAG